MTGLTNPIAHEAHQRPLANRIVSGLVRQYLDRAAATALCIDPINDHERGFVEGVNQMRHLHLAGWDYQLVPKILDELRRAGLMNSEVEGGPTDGQ